MSGARKHLAKRWWGKNGLTIRCTCGQWQSTKGSRREQDDAHRNHRYVMGEAEPRKPQASVRERLAAIQQLAGALKDYLPGDAWHLAHAIEQIASGAKTPAEALAEVDE